MYVSGERWSRGRAPDCQSMRRWFNPTYRRFETKAILSTPHLPVSFGRDIKSRWSLLYGVYAGGSKRSHTGGKCLACSHSLLLEKNNSCVSLTLGCLEVTT